MVTDKEKGGSFSGNKLKNYKSLMKKAGQNFTKKKMLIINGQRVKTLKEKSGKQQVKKRDEMA